MDLSHTVSEIKGDFNRKSIFHTPHAFNAPFELGIEAKGQKLE